MTHLLDSLSEFQIFLLITIVKVVVVLVITLTAVAYTVLLERKLIGRMQNRWGPSRVGPFGLLQPLADGIKLFLKEDLTPLATEKPLFLIAPIIALTCALISVATVPFGAMHRVVVNGKANADIFQIADINVGLLVILGITSIGVYGIALSGWASNNKFALLGSLRATAQVISYELALGLSLVGVVLRAGSLRLRDIVDVQSTHGLLSWNILGGFAREPDGHGVVGWTVVGGFQLLAFFIYLMAAYAETNRSPFDLPEAESELVAGYHTEYSSMKFAMFFMAEYANMITVSCVATLLFFGGASSPLGHLLPDNFGGPILAAIFPILWFVAKIFCFLFLYIWVRSTLPRFRYDQLMDFGWKFLLPVAMANIVATSLVLALRG
ncbi:NADH-quinone oxidoreductase subunit H [Granulicella aggregans]|uniref:NADH-quinone oxidoreductase subunit H n=1 Tax=Granulicella aggregans TaxID=474949 RepID=A0A7W7ZFH7_9BACT|nr:complex I subunit 1 family protein [Granulicella aggregans]MBB5058928.1 NADH-quinone oxidoreductase subunit H [Granulicella aggregans]